MTWDSDLLRSETAFEREWLVTNGIGGYASATLGGANTRRYHGLLVAALAPPLGRAVLLSKLDETLTVETGESWELSANFYPETLHPQGHQFLTRWENGNAPRWTWTLPNGARLTKTVGMVQGKNVTQIAYRLDGIASATLTLTPLLAGKDYHSERHVSPDTPEIFWNHAAATLTATFSSIPAVTDEPIPLFLSFTDAQGNSFVSAAFAYKPDWYRRFQHPREHERGFDWEEDLFAPGSVSLPLHDGETVVVTISAGKRAEFSSLPDWVGFPDDFGDALQTAAHAFLIDVPDGRQSIIAGYPWFSDWGRDTMIALPGLCMPTGNLELAQNILLSYARFADQGMIPNRFPDRGETPDYNTADATLWFFNACFLVGIRDWGLGIRTLPNDPMTQRPNDLLTTHYSLLTDIIAWHRRGTRYGIGVDENDGLLRAGVPGVQLTWMDAKIGDFVVTPRIGKPVEINALWHNALCIMAQFAEQLGKTEDAQQYWEWAAQCAASFRAKFARGDGNGLYDVIDTPDGQSDASIRPNQIFAVSLPFALIAADSDLAREIVGVVERDLLTPCGLRSLSPHDPAYRPHYGGDAWQRDTAYHQGTVWAWLLGAFAEAHFKVWGDREKAKAFLLPLQAQLETYAMGSLAEIFDGDPPHRPNGCVAQAWSVGETLRVWDALHS